MKRKEDSRVINTKQKIKKVFIELVSQKGYQNVHVNEITSMAHINRNTFYLHYSDKNQLFKEILLDISNTIHDEIAIYSIQHSLSIASLTPELIRIAMRKILLILQENEALIQIILKDNDLVDYSAIIFHSVRTDLGEFLKISELDLNIPYQYAYYGMSGILKDWALKKKYTLSEISKVLASLIYVSLKMIPSK